MKKQVISLVFILVLGMFAQVSLIVDSYQGYHDGADCSVCHNEPATSYNSTFGDSTITLDGIANEPFWQEPATEHHTLYIPVASSYGSTQMFVRTVFAQNNTHLFLKMDWEDTTLNGTNQEANDIADGVSIYWDIDGATYDAGFPDGMVTESGSLDVWTWKASPDVENINVTALDTNKENVTVTSTITNDFSMNNFGIGGDGEQNVHVGATYGYQGEHHENSYLVEMAFPFETGFETDIQFDKSGYYTFGFAIFNSSAGANHLMGFEHDVFIVNGEPPVITYYDEEYQTNTIKNTYIENITIQETVTESFPVGVFGVTMLILIAATFALRSRRQ